jgi:hypothetical protein
MPSPDSTPSPGTPKTIVWAGVKHAQTAVSIVYPKAYNFRKL